MSSFSAARINLSRVPIVVVIFDPDIELNSIRYRFPGLDSSQKCPRAFSSEVDTGSREENATKQKARASVLIQSERKKALVPPI